MTKIWVASALCGAMAGISLGQGTPEATRTSGPAKVISLAESIDPFSTQFNADSQELRFLAVLSPS